MLLKRHYRFPEGWKANRNVPCERLVTQKDGVEVVSPGAELGLTIAQCVAAGTPFTLKDRSRPEGELLNPPPISHFEVRHTGIAAEQNFSTSLVETGIAQGFASISEGKLTIKTADHQDDLVYTIKRGPGHYCCHCGVELPDAAQIVSPGVSRGTEHVVAMHAGVKSPDANNASGYMRLNEYQCVLDSKTHEKYKAKSIGEARREAAQYFRERQKQGGKSATKAGV